MTLPMREGPEGDNGYANLGEYLCGGELHEISPPRHLIPYNSHQVLSEEEKGQSPLYRNQLETRAEQIARVNLIESLIIEDITQLHTLARMKSPLSASYERVQQVRVTFSLRFLSIRRNKSGKRTKNGCVKSSKTSFFYTSREASVCDYWRVLRLAYGGRSTGAGPWMNTRIFSV